MTTLSGNVFRKKVAHNSKSERIAVCFHAPSLMHPPGDDYILRRVGGHPFVDSVLRGLVGEHITADGNIQGSTFYMSTWRVH